MLETSCKKRLFGNLVVASEDEVLNATETTLNDEKVTREKIIALFALFH